MAQTKIMLELDNLLRETEEKYYLDGILNKARVIEDLHNYDSELIRILSESEVLKKHFLIEINGTKILKINELIEILEMNEFREDSYTSYENKIGLTSNGRFLTDNKDVVLDFPYKDTVLKASMSKEEIEKEDLLPEEPFLNEKIAREEIDTLFDKKVLINAMKYDKKGTHETDEFTEKDNLIIKGNNLLALHSLKDKYAGKIKMIYIDPPYNTGKDSFRYNDKFNRSSWLTFMKNRLETAKELLSENGMILIHIDNNEQGYLKVLSDQIFNEENFISTLIWQNREGGGKSDSNFFVNKHEYIHVYAKDISQVQINGVEISNIERYKQKDQHYDIRGPYYLQKMGMGSLTYSKSLDYPITIPEDGTVIYPKDNNKGNRAIWRWSKEKLQWGIDNDFVVFKKDSTGVWTVYSKQYLKVDNNNQPIDRTNRPIAFIDVDSDLEKDSVLSAIIEQYSTTQSSKHMRDMFGETIFKYSKPEGLISHLIKICSNEKDIILDFFMGSATTQAVAHKLNRRYIGIEQMDYINTVSLPRLQKVINGEQGGISQEVDWQGGGSFIYAELMEKNTGYLKDILDAESTERLREVFNLMLKYADFDFRVDLEEIKDSVWRLPLEDQKRELIKIIDKNQLYYNYSEIDDENVRDLISDSDYAFNESFYENEGDENE